jgi:surface antigen
MLQIETRPIEEVSGRGWRAAISPASADKRNFGETEIRALATSGFGANKAWQPATAVHCFGGDTERQPRGQVAIR